MDTMWTRCKEALRTKVNGHVMDTWFEPIICEKIVDNRLVLSAPNNFFITWIRDNYLNLLKDIITEVTDRSYEVDFVSRDTPAPELPFTPPPPPPPPPDRPQSVEDDDPLRYNLSSRYTFSSFVVGGCNQFAHAAAKAVSENLGKSYNPLFIYGGVGLGKTHLMSAIGYAVMTSDKSKRVSFSTSEEFTNEMINALRFEKMPEFRNKYRNIDLLMIDDVQFIAGKPRTQEEFFHTFNSLYEARKQIVLTSDRFPNEISDMEQRLRSRFNWGLVADMGTPDLETKIAILKKKAAEDNVILPDDVAFFLASKVESNVRDLVGYLVRVTAMSSLQGIPMSKQLAQNALRDILHRNTKAITVEDVISHVSKAFNVKIVDIKSKKKNKLYSLPRQVGMYLARELTEMSYPGIGAAFGGKDHTTVIYAMKKIDKTMEEDHSMRNLIESLKKSIRE